MSSSTTIADRLQFLRTRLPILAASPASFGLVAAAVTLLDTAFKDAESKNQLAIDARETAKKCTQDQNDALSIMARQQSIVFDTLKTFADARPTVEQRNAIYASALLPAPTPPGPLPAPESPQDVKADPNANGTVTVKWKAKGNAGSVYLVFRKLAGNSTFSQIGYSSKKTFIDGTVPAGTTSCQYQVQAVRGQQTSTASQPVTVQFGAGGAQGFNSTSVGIAA